MMTRLPSTQNKITTFGAVVALMVLIGAALPSAWADVINGVSYIQPTIHSKTCTWVNNGDSYDDGEDSLVDGSGIVAATGFSDTPAKSDGWSAGGGYIIFDLGANFELTSAHIWSRTFGAIRNGGTDTVFDSGPGGLRKFTISTSLSPATTGNAFTTPVDTFPQVTDIPGFHTDNPGFTFPTAGDSIALASTAPARYVMFSMTGGGYSWYTHRNELSWWGLNEVRFFLPGVALENLGHSSVTLTSALANVDLLVTGQSDADVALYWGESDPGETLTGWGDTNNLGTTSTGLISNVSISNLTAETTYFYRFFATNTTAAAAGWSAAGTFSTPALDEWIGASDDLWGNAANWSSANVPDSGGESATFGGFGTGDVDLNGSSYTIGDLKLSAGDYSIVDTNASAGSLTVNALTNAAGANTVEVGMDVAGTAAVSGGRLTLASTADFDANLIALSGGTLSAEGAVTSVNGFIETIFNNPAGLDGQGNIEGYRTRALALGADDAQGILTGPIHYQDKNPDILNRAIALGAVGFDVGNSAMLWITDFVPSESGQWAFKLENIDDDTSFWVDTDGDGVFQIENRFYNRGCCGGTGEELTPALVAGQRYKLGFTFRDGGGGGYIRDLQFKSPSGSLTSIDPGDGTQAGLWNVRTADAVDLSSIPVSVLANSTLDANSGTNVAAFGALSLSNGAVLVTSGNALRFDSTTIADGATTAGFDTGVDTYASHTAGLDGNSAAVTIAKTGAADLVLDLPGVDLGSATFDVQAGSLVAVHSNAFGGATLSLNAGELLLSSPTGDITYVEAIAVVTNSTLTVGQAGDGVVGPLTNTISGDITFSGSDTLTTRATDDYTLRLGGQIVGSGTLDLTGGDVIIDDTSLNAIALNGGALTVFSNLTVNALSQNSGTFTMAGTSKDLTVANTLVLAGALDFTGANLLLDTATVTLNNGANITYDQNLPVDMITMNGNAILTLNNSALLPGTLTLNNGTLNHNDAGMVATNVTINGGTLNHLNHPFHADSLTFNGGTFNLGTNALNVGTLLARAGGTFNVTGPITGTTTLSFEPVRVVDNLLAGSADVLIGELLTSDGAVTFSATNTYTGKTQIDRGVLRADEGAGLPTNSLLEFSLLNSAQHGVLETSGTFARKIGSSAGQVRWEDHGGFAARGGPLTLSLTRNDDAVAPLAWTDPDNGFGSAILSFGSLSANSMVHLTNDIEMDQNSEIRVHNNADASITGDVFKVSGDIVESGGSQFLIKTGAGVLWLSGSNTWNGITYLRDGGTLRAVNGMGLSTNDSYLRFENGIFESWGTFARNIGAQADSGNVYWENQGGFAAFGGNLDVTLEQETFGPLDWGDANTGFRGQELYLGSQTATHVVDLKNDINLNGNRNLRAFDNINTDQDVGKISGIIANGSGTSQLRQLGNASIHAGTLWLTGTNTYTGNTWIDQGTIRAVDGVGLPTDSRLTFEVDNNGFPCSFESKGSFTRYTGTGSTNVHWQEQGGFAAWGGRLTVDLHGAGTSPELTWNLPAGGFNGQPLLMGSRTANDVVDMVDDIHLNGNRDIYVFDNPHSGSDVTVFSGNIRDNGNNNLQIYRDGVLKLNGTNTYRNLYINNTAKVYINGTHNSGGLLEVRNNQGGTIGGAGSITIGTFSVRDTDTLAPGDEGPGTLTTSVSAAEGLDMWNNSIYEWELGPAVSDTVNQTGNIRLEPGWTVKLVAAGGSPRADVEYDLFTYTGTATYGAPQFDTNSIPADWRTDTLTVVHDVAGKRVYLTGLYSVQSVANDEPTAVTPATATLNGFVSAQADPLYVSVFWGTNNGGMVAADWLEDGFTADLGSFNSVTSQPVSHGIAGLVSNELWYYTFYATNATGSVNLWAAPSIAFNAAGAPIVTNTGAGNFAAGTAWLSGLFLDHNRADVTLCWGTTDGGMTTPSAWQNTLNIGTPGTADFAGNATNVLFGAGQYVYRIYAASAYGTDWSDPATAFTQSVQPGVLAVTADLEAWYAASTLALSDGDPVVAWTDASTNARHLVTYQGTPNFKADVINGLPAVNFDNESLQMDVANPYLPMDVFLVFRSAYNTTFGPDWGAPIGVKDGPDADRMWMLQGNEDRFGDQELPGAVVRNGVAVSSANNFDMGNIDASEYMILKVTLGPNSGTQVRDVIVGSRTDAWPNSRFDTSEVLAYSSELSAADESLVGGYLASKYGINTPYPDSGALSTIANAAAAGVTHNSAWLNASLQAAGATFDVVAYWGPVDQSNNAALWANSAPVGTFDDGSFAPTFQATGLPELATTYFTFRATNLVQNLWADDVASFVTDTSALGAQFSGSPLVGKSPLVVSFTDSSSGTNITSRFWDFGDGQTTNTASTVVWHTYTNIGAYSVELVVSDAAAGNASTNTKVDYVFVSSPLMCVDFNGSVSPTNYAGPGALGYVGDTWNYVAFTDGWSSDKPFTNLVDSSGADSGVTFTFTYGLDAAFNTWGQDADALFGDYMGVWGGGSQNIDMQLSGLTPGTYDLVTFGVASVTWSANGSVPVSLDGTGTGAGTFVQGQDYALLHVTVEDDGLLTILTTGNGRFCGFQLRDSRGATWLGGDTGGDIWTTGTNWLAEVPRPGAGAIFGHLISAGHATADLDAETSVSWLDFLNTVPTTITATNGSTLTLVSQEMPNGDVISPVVSVLANSSHAINANLAGSDGLLFTTSAGYQGNATLTLGGNNTHTGPTTISGPPNQAYTILRAGSSQALGGSILGFNRRGGQERLVFQLNGHDITVPGLNYATGGNDGGGYGSFGGYIANISTQDCTLTVNADVDCTYNGNFSDAGSGSLALVKDGAGTLTLREANTYHAYSGGLTIKDGKLVPNGSGNVLGTGGVTMGDAGKTGTLVHSGATTFDQAFTMAAGGVGAFEFAADVTLSGVVSGEGGLTKTGAGTLTLTNSTNSWNGDTSVDVGTLSISTNHLADTADVRVATGAILDLNFDATDTVRELYSNGVAQVTGTWGAVGSGADNESSLFSGPGILNVVGSVPVAPTALFSATPTNGVAPLVVTFTDTSTGTVSNRFWDFGNGHTTNTTSTAVASTYTNAGMYTVQLIVSGSLGSSTNTKVNYVVVSSPLPPPPMFAQGSFSATGGVSSLTFDTEAGYRYGVQYRDSLMIGIWLPLIVNPNFPPPEGWSAVSVGAPMMIVDTNSASTTNRFYQIRATAP